jgi:hypothetical protein
VYERTWLEVTASSSDYEVGLVIRYVLSIGRPRWSLAMWAATGPQPSRPAKVDADGGPAAPVTDSAAARNCHGHANGSSCQVRPSCSISAIAAAGSVVPAWYGLRGAASHEQHAVAAYHIHQQPFVGVGGAKIECGTGRNYTTISEVRVCIRLPDRR